MDELVRTLLKALGVTVFPETASGGNEFTQNDFHERYDAAFESSKDPCVVLAIVGPLEQIFLVDSVNQLWRYRDFGGAGFHIVLRIPKKVWIGIEQQLTPRIFELGNVAA